MGKPTPGQFYIGTSGLVLPVPNKQAFPPAFRNKSRLTYYSSLLNSLEVNSSFYKIPRPATVRKWTEEVPDQFTFTFKLWQEITHAKGLAFKPEDVRRFMDVISEAGDKKGCLLVQFPPSVTVDRFAQVEDLLGAIQSSAPGHGWKLALELRHPSWYISELYELADEHEGSVVLHDMPKSANWTLNKKAAFVYLRFHGPAGDYRGGYADDFLQQQATQVRHWLHEGKDVFVYFNNTIDDAFNNATTLNAMVNAER